jgi:hypothetical protein
MSRSGFVSQKGTIFGFIVHTGDIHMSAVLSPPAYSLSHIISHDGEHQFSYDFGSDLVGMVTLQTNPILCVFRSGWVYILQPAVQTCSLFGDYKGPIQTSSSPFDAFYSYVSDIRSFACDPRDGHTIALVDREGKIHVWELQTDSAQSPWHWQRMDVRMYSFRPAEDSCIVWEQGGSFRFKNSQNQWVRLTRKKLPLCSPQWHVCHEKSG